MAVREKVGDELAKLVDDEVPEALVSNEMQERLQDLAFRLQAQGIGLEQYLQITGRDPEAFIAELRETADEAVRVDLALRAVADAEDLDATDEDLDDEIELLVGDAGLTLEDAREELTRGGQVSAVRSDLRSARRSTGSSSRARSSTRTATRSPRSSSPCRRTTVRP